MLFLLEPALSLQSKLTYRGLKLKLPSLKLLLLFPANVSQQASCNVLVIYLLEAGKVCRQPEKNALVCKDYA